MATRIIIPGTMELRPENAQEALAAHFHKEGYSKMREHIGDMRSIGATTSKCRVDAEAAVYDETMTPRADFSSDPNQGKERS